MSFKGFVKYPLPTSGWAWYNQASSTATTIGNGIRIYTPKNASGASITGYHQTAPATPYTVIAHISLNQLDTTGLEQVGLGFDDGTKYITLLVKAQANTYSSGWSVQYGTNSTTATGDRAGYKYAYGFPFCRLGWLAIRDDGTNVYFYVGDDSGDNFYEMFHEARTTSLTAVTSIGLYSDAQGSSIQNWSVDSWQVIGV